MNRRDFLKTLAGGTLSTAALALEPLAILSATAAGSDAAQAPFKHE